MWRPIMKHPAYKCVTLLFILLLCGVSLHASAQGRLNMTVEGFEIDQTDRSALGSLKAIDINSNLPYAVVKVKPVNPGDDLTDLEFEFNNLTHKTVPGEHGNELWLYVPDDARKVTIRRDGYKTLPDYVLEPKIRSGVNYVMYIRCDEKKMYLQTVKFVVTPPESNAFITVTNLATSKVEPLGSIASDGTLSKTLPCGRYSYTVMASDFKTTSGKFTLNYSGPDLIGPPVEEKVSIKPNYSIATLKADSGVEIILDGRPIGVGEWSGPLSAGIHNVVCRKEKCRDSQQIIEVGDSDSSFRLLLPEPIIGYATVNSMPSDARISVDGKDYGLTPSSLKLPLGRYNITLSKPDYQDYTETIEIVEDTPKEVSAWLVAVAPKANETPVNQKQTELTGSSSLDNESPKVAAEGANAATAKTQNNFSAYVDLGVMAAQNMALAVDAGVYFRNFNVQLDYMAGFGSSPTIYWSYLGDDNDIQPDECTYKPSLNIGGKLGYGFRLGNRVRLTPQVGVRFTRLTEKRTGIQDHIRNANCIDATVGVRAYFAITRNFGVSLTPEYAVAVRKSEGLKSLSAISSKFKSLTEGFGAKIAVTAMF